MRNGPEAAGDAALLTAPDAHAMLDSAVATMGGELHDWSVTQVDHRPGRSTTVAYRTRIAWPDGEHTETLGARVSTKGSFSATRDPRILRMSDGEHEVQVWRFPADPALPALATVLAPHTVADLLRNAGVDPVGARVRVVGYRPCRRAVVEITTPHTRVFVKVLRPGMASDVHRRLVLTRAAGLPTPRSLGWSDNGLVVLEPLPGVGLREAVRRHGTGACSPDELVRLLDELPGELIDLPRRTPWSESAGHYAGVVGAAVPDSAERAIAAADAIAAGLDGAPDDGAVHGDFYEAQLLAECGRITGLLDIDTAGPGQRVDDLACLVAHLSVLVVMAPAASAGVRAALAEWTRRFDQSVDPRQLRVRAAGVTLSLATGPYRTQEPGWARAVLDRLGLVEEWLAAARTGGLPEFERPLIHASGPFHQG
jgi:Phosphotransferase enzyme family